MAWTMRLLMWLLWHHPRAKAMRVAAVTPMEQEPDPDAVAEYVEALDSLAKANWVDYIEHCYKLQSAGGRK